MNLAMQMERFLRREIEQTPLEALLDLEEGREMLLNVLRNLLRIHSFTSDTNNKSIQNLSKIDPKSISIDPKSTIREAPEGSGGQGEPNK